MNAATCQYVNQCAASLPYTGYALAAVLLIGLVLIVAGFIARRRSA